MNDNYPFLFSDPAEEERQDRQRWRRMHEDEDARRKQRDAISMGFPSAGQRELEEAKHKRNDANYLLTFTKDLLEKSSSKNRRARAEYQAIQTIKDRESFPGPLDTQTNYGHKGLLDAARQRHAEMTAKVTQEMDALNRSRELNKNAHREAVVQLILQRSAERAIEQLAKSGAWGHSDLPQHVSKAMAPHVRDELGKAPCHRAALEKKIHEV